MQLPDPISIMQQFVDSVNRREMDAVIRMFDEDATLSFEPPLPGSPKPEYSGRGEIESSLGALMAEHLQMTAGNWQVSGEEVTWDTRLSADRFAELGIDPLQARAHAVLEGSFIDSIDLVLEPESVQKVQRVTAAER